MIIQPSFYNQSLHLVLVLVLVITISHYKDEQNSALIRINDIQSVTHVNKTLANVAITSGFLTVYSLIVKFYRSFLNLT